MKPSCPCCGQPVPDSLVTVYRSVLIVPGHPPLPLPPVKAAILRYLLSAWPETRTRDQMTAAIYPINDEPADPYRTLMVHIYRLRQMIRGSGVFVRNVYGYGYRIEIEARGAAVRKREARRVA